MFSLPQNVSINDVYTDYSAVTQDCMASDKCVKALGRHHQPQTQLSYTRKADGDAFESIVCLPVNRITL